MRAWLVVLLIALAGCSDGGGGGGAATTSTTSTGPMAEENTTRDPVSTPAVASCEFTAAGVITGGVNAQMGPNDIECDLLIEPLNRDDILPFKAFIVEMRWDEAQQTINNVGFEYDMAGQATGSTSASPNGQGGELSAEGTITSEGSTRVMLERIFDGTTSGWSAEVRVSLFELDAVPAGYTAF